ncbi:deoxyribose-phosphate aldolase [Sulfobacillus thermosulfidooxidans]|uniref:deoxyribose-phosphate aldolase n=1 Tax=Sulfobacillus thermosulfidooxidans TaxID=28034 RepID=UPI0009EA614A|nr:deoxyribose-phosphate aldolase [Sulfobacillus thermosulfidooxidans]
MTLIDNAVQQIRPVLYEEEWERIQAIQSLYPHMTDKKSANNDLASFIDHTLLNPDATPEQIRQLCEDALKWQTYAVCINSWLVPTAHEVLAGTAVKLATVVGFPLGACASTAKAYESTWAMEQGADEIDMVINRGALKARAFRYVLDDILLVRQAAPAPIILKVIVESQALSDVEKVMAALLSVAAGADFVKTSTGFDKKGATVADVQLLRSVVGAGTGVKAAGGIHSREEAWAMVAAGANRIGASRTRDILQEE